MFTGIVRDEDLALHGELVYETPGKVFADDVEAGQSDDTLIDGADATAQENTRQLEHTATLQYFLDRKEHLLKSLKVLNTVAEQELALRGEDGSSSATSGPTETQFTENFLQQQQWVIDNVMRSDHIIAQLLQQLNGDTSLCEQGAINPLSSNGIVAIQTAWTEQYDRLKYVEIPLSERRAENLTAGLLLGADIFNQQEPLTRNEENETKYAATDIPRIDSDTKEISEELCSIVELYKICICCLALLKKYQLEEFCRPKELCEFLVSKVDGYNNIAQMRSVVQKIEAICFGLS